MPGKTFSKPVRIVFPTPHAINTANEAAVLLMDVRWPKKGPRHRDALETCLKVIDGHRSTVDAEFAFLEACHEAGVLDT